MEEEAAAAVASLQRAGINFVAVDFDCTLVTQHTRGRWNGSAKDLAIHIRPIFAVLVPTMIDNGLCVAIVTFSSQAILIRKVLEICFPHHHEKIVLRTSDGTWGNMGDINRDRKQKYMGSAAEELSQMNNVEISRGSTLLIDDDLDNIRVALDNFTRAIPLDPADPNRIINDILDLSQSSARLEMVYIVDHLFKLMIYVKSENNDNGHVQLADRLVLSVLITDLHVMN
eukprot:gene12489-16755_t